MTEQEAREQIITQAEAIREFKRHGFTRDSLIRDLGNHPTYKGADVLDALGY